MPSGTKPACRPWFRTGRSRWRLPDSFFVKQVDDFHALAVENAPAGVESAKSAGLYCVALCTTLPADCLSQADLILPDHEALGRWLLGTWAV